jgi:hypothetical protein
LASLLGMNREEREEYVVQLYKENNSIREIATNNIVLAGHQGYLCMNIGAL